MSEPIYFVHITDTHFGPTADFERHGYQSWPCAEKLVGMINDLPQKPDFVIHTGDVANDPDPATYQIAAEVLGKINVPAYYVVGNHDTAADIRHFMTQGACEYLSETLLTYRFDLKGQRFLTLDGRAPDEMDPQGLISAEQMAIVEDEVKNGTMPLTLFIHFPLFSVNAPWMDPRMLVSNGEALHQALLPARDRINGVFYGHIHQHTQVIRDGILYTSAASSFAQFSGWPTDVEGHSSDAPPGYSFVKLLGDRMAVHPMTFVRP